MCNPFGGSPPAAPDYTGAAQMDARSAWQQMQYQTFANRPNIYTPYGNMSWQGPGWTDAMTGASNNGRGAFGPGAWAIDVSLDPQVQNALNTQQRIQEGRSALAEGLLWRAGEQLSEDMPVLGSNWWPMMEPAAAMMQQAPPPAAQQQFQPVVQQQQQTTSTGGLQPPPRQNTPWDMGPDGPYVATVNGQTGVWAPGYGFFSPEIPDWLFWGDDKKLHNKNATDPTQPWNPPSDWRGGQNYRYTPQGGQPPGGGQTQPPPTQPPPTQPPPTQPPPTQPPPPVPLSARDRAEEALYSRTTSRLDPRLNRQREELRSELYNMGLRPGMEAYDAQMEDFERVRTDAYQTAMRESIMGGGAEASREFAIERSIYEAALARRLQAVNEMNAALSGQQAQAPQFPGFQGAGAAPGGTDFLGAAQAGYQSQLGAYNAQQAGDQNFLQGLLGFGALGASLLSDARLKHGIERSSEEVIPGVPFARWTWYDGSPGFGVIAQDVERVRPDLVVEVDGYKHVNYGGLR